MVTAPADTDLSRAIAAERRDLAAVLAALPEQAWDTPSLCAGWRVREVVAHMTMPFRYSGRRFIAELARSGGNFSAMSDRCARRDAAAPAADLLAALRDNAEHPWQPPGGGLTGALSHDVIHGLDFTVPLGVGRTVPAEHLTPVLQSVTGRALKHFGTDLSGVELRATDLDWGFGAGQVLAGRAQDLLLVIAGRSLPTGHLTGEHAGRFTR
jgi:uncharacterized protein (TIGR03083 family)